MWNMQPLTDLLHQNGLKVHIETSGAYPLSGFFDWICLSPKKTMPPTREVLVHANELKVIIHNQHDFTWAEENAAEVGDHCHYFYNLNGAQIPRDDGGNCGLRKRKPRLERFFTNTQIYEHPLMRLILTLCLIPALLWAQNSKKAQRAYQKAVTFYQQKDDKKAKSLAESLRQDSTFLKIIPTTRSAIRKPTKDRGGCSALPKRVIR